MCVFLGHAQGSGPEAGPAKRARASTVGPPERRETERDPGERRAERASTRETCADDRPGGEPIARTGRNEAAVGRRMEGWGEGGPVGNRVGAIKISKTYAGPFRDEDKRQQS